MEEEIPTMVMIMVQSHRTPGGREHGQSMASSSQLTASSIALNKEDVSRRQQQQTHLALKVLEALDSPKRASWPRPILSSHFGLRS